MRFALFLILIIATCRSASAQAPKREFRGAWIQTVYQDHYAARSAGENRRWLSDELDALQRAGINAVIFQVRPSADAFYHSDIEPSSRFLTGKCGKTADWDPLEFMVEQCHARGMEIHAWLNPYRITTSKNETLPDSHVACRHPERTVRYDGRLYFNPALQANRDLIVEVVGDIVDRYDIDAIHFDDYFYPYPVKGQTFDDTKAFKATGKGMKIADWRRSNVDSLISQVSRAIKTRKPWVRFGISPFGIWRNKASDPRGSDTRGLQNYDDLYADVLLWADNRWIDYLTPQLYWATDHRLAGWDTLAQWWNGAVSNDCPVFVGQDVKVTVGCSELDHKINRTREFQSLQGSCWWPASLLTSNHGGISDRLEGEFHCHPALPPAYPAMSSRTPEPVSLLSADFDGILTWATHEPSGDINDAVMWAVYLFPTGRDTNLSDAESLHGITRERSFALPEGFRGTVAVTSLSRVNIESRPTILHIP